MATTNIIGLQNADYNGSNAIGGNWFFDGNVFSVQSSTTLDITGDQIFIGVSGSVSTLDIGGGFAPVNILSNGSLYRVIGGGDLDFNIASNFNVVAGVSVHFTVPAMQLTGLSSISPVGKFNIIVDGSGNVSFSSVANGGGGGTAWEIGGNTGLSDPSYLGSNSPAGVHIGTNNITVLSLGTAQELSVISSSLSLESTGIVTLASSAAASLQIGYTGMPVNLFASALVISANTSMNIMTSGSMTLSFNGLDAFTGATGAVQIGTQSGNFDAGTAAGVAGFHGTSVLIEAENGSLTIQVKEANAININGNGTLPGSINLATVLIHELNIGNSITDFTFVGDDCNWSLQSSLTVNAGYFDLTSADLGHISLSGLGNADISLITSTGAINLNSAIIKAPSLPTAIGGEKILMIAADGTLRVSP